MSDIDISGVSSKLPKWFHDPKHYAELNRSLNIGTWFTHRQLAISCGSSYEDALAALELLADEGILLRRWEIHHKNRDGFYLPVSKQPEFPVKYEDRQGRKRRIKEEDAIVTPAFQIPKKREIAPAEPPFGLYHSYLPYMDEQENVRIMAVWSAGMKEKPFLLASMLHSEGDMSLLEHGRYLAAAANFCRGFTPEELNNLMSLKAVLEAAKK